MKLFFTLYFIICAALSLTDFVRARVEIHSYNRTESNKKEDAMMLMDMENFVKEARKEYRDALEKRTGVKASNVRKEYLNSCYSDFERQTIEENLKEEFDDFLMHFVA